MNIKLLISLISCAIAQATSDPYTLYNTAMYHTDAGQEHSMHMVAKMYCLLPEDSRNQLQLKQTTYPANFERKFGTKISDITNCHDELIAALHEAEITLNHHYRAFLQTPSDDLAHKTISALQTCISLSITLKNADEQYNQVINNDKVILASLRHYSFITYNAQSIESVSHLNQEIDSYRKLLKNK